MSWKATAHVKGIGRASGITRSEKLLLLILADYHNDETGQCDPSQGRLADDALMSRRTVQTALYALQKKGFIRIEDRRGAGTSMNTCQYWLTCLDQIAEGGAKTAQGGSAVRDRKGSATATAQGLRSQRSQGVAQPRDRSNRNLNLNMNRKLNPKRAPRAAGGGGLAPVELGLRRRLLGQE